ncbi:MAG: hypothetical protein JST16_05300 [Bdellovibrionales bacterium]|nr:hypothetical protein [Bdellovibrionales bacterium]
MTHPNHHTAPLTLRFCASRLLTTLTLATPLFVSACASTCTKSARISRIADQQLVVIESVQRERGSPAVSGPASKNEALRRAEAHLSEALDALKRSVEAINQEEEK